MNKKLIPILLAVGMSVAAFVGCKPTVDEGLLSAAEFLKMSYLEDNLEVRADYTMPSIVNGYPVTWSVNVDSGVKIIQGEGEVATIIDVDENAAADIPYVLTATLTNDKGLTEVVEFSGRTVLKALALTPEAISASPVEGTPYKLYVYQSKKNADCYFSGKMSGYYYGTVENYAEAVDVYAEKVPGVQGEYYLYFQDELDGKQYITIQEGWNSKSSHWTFNPEITSDSITSFKYEEQYGTIVATIFARSSDDYSNQDAEPSVNTTVYLGNYSTHMTLSVSNISYFGGEGNNVGGLVEMVDKSTVSVADKLAFEKDALTVETEFNGNATVDLATVGSRYTDVTIAWSEESDNLAIENGKLTITAPTAETTVTLTATLTIGETTETKTFELTIAPAVILPEANTEITIPQALEIGAAQPAGEYTSDKYYITGTITSIKNTQYGNVYIKDANDNELYIYGLVDADGNNYEAMTTKPQVGDTIKVLSAVGNYNGDPQLKNAQVVEITAGEGGNEGGEVTPSTPVAITAKPEEGVAYSLFMNQTAAGKLVYLAGGTDNADFRLATTETASEAVKLFVEYLEGSSEQFSIYYLDNETKTYLTIVISGTYTNVNLTTTKDTTYPWTYNTTYNTIAADVDGVPFILGTRSDKTYTNIEAKKATEYEPIMSYLFVASEEGGNEGGDNEGGEVTPPAEEKVPVAITAAPVVGTAYKFYVYQTSQTQDCYFTGVQDGYYFTTAESHTGGVDVFVENVDGDTSLFYIYFLNDSNAKQYLGVEEAWNTSKSKWSYNPSISATPTCAFAWNAEVGTMTTTIKVRATNDQTAVADTDKTFYLGNYSSYVTISASDVSYAATSNVGKLVTMETKAPEGGEEGGDNEGNEGGNEGGETPVVPTIEEISISDALTIGAGLENYGSTEVEYYVTGTIVHIENTVKGNVTIADGEGNTIYVYGLLAADGSAYADLALKPVVGDTVKLLSVINKYQGNAQLKNAKIMSSSTLTDMHKVIIEGMALEVTSEIKQAGAITLPVAGATYTDVVIAWESDNACAVVDGANVTFTLGDSATAVTLTATVTLDECSKTYTFVVAVAAKPIEGGIVVTKTSEELATANSWEVTAGSTGTNLKDTTVALDDVVSFTINGGANSGKYYADGIRVYASDTPAGTITVTVAEGYELASVKIMTLTGTYAFLQIAGDTTENYSNLAASVSGSSVTFNAVKNGSNGKQVRVIGFEVVYKATAPATEA